MAVVEVGALGLLMQCLKEPSLPLRRVTLACLGCMAKHDQACAELLEKEGVVAAALGVARSDRTCCPPATYACDPALNSIRSRAYTLLTSLDHDASFGFDGTMTANDIEELFWNSFLQLAPNHGRCALRLLSDCQEGARDGCSAPPPTAAVLGRAGPASFTHSHALGLPDAQDGRFCMDRRLTLSYIWDVFPICNLYM